MNLTKQLKNIGMAATVGSLSLLSSTVLNAATVTFDQGDVTMDMSAGTLTLDLMALGLDPTTAGMGLGIKFDANVLSFNSATVGSFWNLGTPSATSPTADTFEVYGSTLNTLLGTPTPSSVGIASITFDLVGAGSFAFEFYSIGAIGDWGYEPAVVTAAPAAAAYCLTDTLNALTCLNADSSDPLNLQLLLDPTALTVTGAAVVPVPAAVWLFGSGLIGLVAVSRRKA